MKKMFFIVLALFSVILSVNAQYIGYVHHCDGRTLYISTHKNARNWAYKVDVSNVPCTYMMQVGEEVNHALWKCRREAASRSFEDYGVNPKVLERPAGIIAGVQMVGEIIGGISAAKRAAKASKAERAAAAASNNVLERVNTNKVDSGSPIKATKVMHIADSGKVTISDYDF